MQDVVGEGHGAPVDWVMVLHSPVVPGVVVGVSVTSASTLY